MTENITECAPEIAAAVIQVMAKVQKLKKSDRNKHAAYDFVSVDKFLETFNPLCAEAGLFFVIDEVETLITARSSYTDGSGRQRDVAPALTVTYNITLCHSSGKMMGPIRRHVTVVANGAQAYGSAQSYVLKQFMRSLFQVPTGDRDDPDFQPANEMSPELSKAKSRKSFELLQENIRAADSEDALGIVWREWKHTVETFPADWREQIMGQFSTRKTDIQNEQAGQDDAR